MSEFQVNGTYGSAKTESIIYAYEDNDGFNWYCVDGSLNVNSTWDNVDENCDVEELNDDEHFTLSSPCHSLTQFKNIMEEHLAPQTRTIFNIAVDSANEAFQDNPTEEVIRLLNVVIAKLRDSDEDSEDLKDINGNVCGAFDFELKADY